MHTIVALYRGAMLGEVKIVAASSDPDLVAYVAGEMLRERPSEADTVISAIDSGRRRALQLIEDEAANDPR
jgi:hypothetical protein